MPNLALVFKALADGTRQRILQMLAQGELSAGEIAAAFDMAQPSVSHHLAVLKQAGLVSARRQGQQIIYAIDYSGLDECWRRFLGPLLAQGRPAPASGRPDWPVRPKEEGYHGE